MTDQNRQGHFIRRILWLLRLLEENHLEPGHIPESGWPPPGLSPEERGELEAVQSAIRFMDEMPGGFFIYYAGGEEQVIYANQGMLRLFQCGTLREFRELTGNSFKGIVHPEDLDGVEASIRKQIAENRYDLDYVEYRIRRKDGSVLWVEDYGHFIHAGEAGDVFYVFLGDPADERGRQLAEQEQALREALEKADLAVKAKNTFLSQISHEMRTPLNAIFGFMTLAKTTLADPAAAASYLEQAEAASHQLLDMITKALDVSSLSDAAGSPEEEECDLGDTLQEVHDFLLPQAQEKGISFTLDCGGVTHKQVYANQKKLRQLALNLANNAITYTESGGVSVVLTEEKPLSDSHIVYRLEVRDTGVGISDEFLEKVFEPFSREQVSTLSGIRGIGLGLTIAKSIVDMLNGSIQVKTSVGEGTTFIVLLPFRVHLAAGAAVKKAPQPRPKLRILLAEDNDINREIETELLERIGFVVDPAADGLAAWEKAQKASPGDYDLVILDLQMPLMDGWEVAAAIRGLPDPTMARIPIVALSANSQLDDQRRSLESGFDTHLPKPLDLNVLLETIGRLTKKPLS